MALPNTDRQFLAILFSFLVRGEDPVGQRGSTPYPLQWGVQGVNSMVTGKVPNLHNLQKGKAMGGSTPREGSPPGESL